MFHPDTAATSLMLSDLFRCLTRNGASITVLCGFPSKDSREEVALLPRSEIFDGVRIERCGLRLQGKRNLLFRALAYLSFLAHAAWRLIPLARTSTVAGGTDPPFTPVFLWLLSAGGLHFRYDLVLHDIYPDILIGVGTLSPSSPAARLWRLANRLAFRRARRVVVIGRDMEARVRDGYGVDPDRIRFLRLWAVAEADGLPRTATGGLLGRLGLQGRFVVQYAGNMGLLHDMDTLVRAAALLRDDPEIHFLFIGKGMRRATAERLAADLGLSTITWLEFLSRDRLAEALTSCDASLISLRAGIEGVAVPSKLYAALASGRAVIAQVPSASEVALTVGEERCGLVVPPGDAAALAAAIRALVKDRAICRTMGERARAAYDASYTIDHAVRAYADLWDLPILDHDGAETA